jgi:hypothetical protein
MKEQLTREQILEADKVVANSIAGIRDFLSLIASERDEDKLTATVIENYESATLHFVQIGVVVEAEGLDSKLSASLLEIDICLGRLLSSAIPVRRPPQKPKPIEFYRKRLADSVEQDVPAIKAALDQIEQALRETRL